MTSRNLTSLALSAMLLNGIWAAPASACRSVYNSTPIFHETLPELQEGEVAAQVVITRGEVSFANGGVLEARVERVLSGNLATGQILIDLQITTSCDAYPQIGTSGIIVGRVIEGSDTETRIAPRRALSQNQLRLGASSVE